MKSPGIATITNHSPSLTPRRGWTGEGGHTGIRGAGTGVKGRGTGNRGQGTGEERAEDGEEGAGVGKF